MPGPGMHGGPGGPGGGRRGGPGGPGGHHGGQPPMGGGMGRMGGMGHRPPPPRRRGCCGCLLPVIALVGIAVAAFAMLLF